MPPNFFNHTKDQTFGHSCDKIYSLRIEFSINFGVLFDYRLFPPGLKDIDHNFAFPIIVI